MEDRSGSHSTAATMVFLHFFGAIKCRCSTVVEFIRLWFKPELLTSRTRLISRFTDPGLAWMAPF